LIFDDVRVFADDVPGLTVIADLAMIDGGVKAQSESVFGNTFREAQLYNLQMQKVRFYDGSPL